MGLSVDEKKTSKSRVKKTRKKKKSQKSGQFSREKTLTSTGFYLPEKAKKSIFLHFLQNNVPPPVVLHKNVKK